MTQDKRPTVAPCLVQDTLRSITGRSLAMLRTELGILIGWGRRFPNLVSLSATQQSPLDNPLVHQCHGLVLDMSDQWNIIARPTDWFPNLNTDEKPLLTNWGDLLVQERLDGIRYNLYYYRGEWHVGTLDSPDGNTPVILGPAYQTHADLFWEQWLAHGYELPSVSRWSDWCFSWELLHPAKRNIVIRKEPTLRLIGMRCRNGMELDFNKLHWGEAYGYWLTAHEYRFKDFDHLISTFVEMDPTKNAGYVLVDPTWRDGEAGFRRLGVNHPGFDRLAKIRGKMTIQRALDLIRKDEVGDLLHHFPEWKVSFDLVAHKYAETVAELLAGWDELYTLNDVEFNRKAIGYRMNNVLFEKRRDPSKDITAILRNYPVHTLLWGLRLRDADI